MERIPGGDTELLDSLAADPRVPGLKIILVTPSGARGRKRRHPKNDLVVGVLEKPFGNREMAEAIESFLADSLSIEGGNLLATRGKEEQ
jgi:hypothetical protein